MLESSLDGEREQIWRKLGEPHKPLSIASVEEKLDQVQRTLGDRARLFGNLPRLNHLLQLVQLHLSRLDDHQPTTHTTPDTISNPRCLRSRKSSLDDRRKNFSTGAGGLQQPRPFSATGSQTRVRPSKSLYAGTSTGATEVGSGLYTPGD
jgi:hypothetical protein